MILFVLNSCDGQNNKSMNTDINSLNITEKIYEQVKHYPKEPVYQVFVKNSLCVYELLVNDYPIANEREYGQLMTPFTINSAILKSGKQKITLRLYPAPAEYSRSGDVLSPNTSCTLEIEYVDNKDPEYKYIPVTKFELPTKVRMAGRDNDIAIPEFEGAGKKYYEITYEFDANVPYEIKGWSEGQDLSKLNQDQLTKKALEAYNYRKKIVENRDINAIAKQLYNPIKEQMISEYETKDYIKKAWDEYIEIYKNYSTFEFKPLINYNKKFYGNGRLLNLEQSDLEINKRGKSALWGRFKDNQQRTGSEYIRILLYLPEGKNLEDGLEVIR